jgi:ribose transport system substrate-binding protein
MMTALRSIRGSTDWGEHAMSFMNARRNALSFFVLMALGPAGCGGGAADQAADQPASGSSPASVSGSQSTSGGALPRLMIVTNGNSDWWTAVDMGMNDGAKEFGARVEMRRNTQGDPAGQIRLLEDVLSLPDVQGVAVSVLEAESPGVADKMRDLQKAGKVVITIDSDGQKDARRAYIGTINRKAGEVAGKAARTLRPQGGRTVMFVGTASAANASERREGFFVGAGPEFQKVKGELFEDGTDYSRAQSNVQTAIGKYPDAGVFLGLWSYNAHYIAEEVAKSPELRKKVTIVTFDLDELASGDLARGAIDVTVCQNPYQMGYLGVRLLKAFVTKDQKTIDEMLPAGTDTIDTGVRVIVPTKDSPVKGDNVIDIDEMKKWLASKGLKSS